MAEGQNAGLTAEIETLRAENDRLRAGLVGLGASAPKTEVVGVRSDHPCVGINRVLDADAGTIEMLDRDGTPRKRFAIVGFASSTCMMAPFDDPSWAIIGMNQLYRRIPREDVHIEIHKAWNEAVIPGTDHRAWMAECGIPILMAERLDGFPTSVRFPVDALIKEVTDYFTSTVAFEVAYVTWHIDRLVEERLRATPPNGLATALDVLELTRSIYAEYSIGIFGVDLIVGEEYDHQKACAEFWIGRALAKGITVVIPPQSALCKQRYRYGYESEPNDLIKASDIAKREAFLRGELQKFSDQAVALQGALTELGMMAEFRRLRERGGTL